MLSARAKSARWGASWFSNKRKIAFWTVVAIGGLIPVAAQAVTATPPATTQPQLSPAKMLTLSEAQSAIPDLKIDIENADTNQAVAVLSGLVPEACSKKLSVVSTTRDASMTDPAVKALNGLDSTAVSAGFAIHDNGGFLTCMDNEKKQGRSCTNAPDNYTCPMLSALGADADIPLPENETVALSYLNKVNEDSAAGSGWSAVNTGDNTLISLSQATIQAQKAAAAAARKAKQNEVLQNEIQTCAQSRDGIDEARALLNSRNDLDADTIDMLNSKIKEWQARFDKQDLQSLQKRAQLAIENNQIDKFDGIESDIYDYYQNHSDSDSDSTTLGDELGQMILDMAHKRVDAANSDADIDKAQTSLENALDPVTGLKMSDKMQNTYEAALKPYTGNIAQARLGLAEQACDEASANLQYARQQLSSNPMMMQNQMSAMNTLNGDAKSETSACQAANKMYDADMKGLDKELKDDHCSAMASSSMPSMNLFGGGSSSGGGSGGNPQCQTLSQQGQSMQNMIGTINANVQQEAQQAMQSLRQQQNPMSMMGPMGSQGGTMGMMQPQIPMGPGGSFMGAPSSPTFSNPFVQQGSYYAGSPYMGGAYYGSPAIL